MAAFQSLDQTSLDHASNHGPFSQALDSDFTLQPISGDHKFSSGPDVFSKGGFNDQSLAIDTSFLSNPALQAQSDQPGPLRPRLPHSPPGSGNLAPKQWSFDGQRTLPTQSFRDGQDSPTAYSLYGQMTPPDDKVDHLLDENFEQTSHQHIPDLSLAAGQSPQAANMAESESRTKPKRNRKTTTRGSKKNAPDSHDPNDVRRSKFLERNRVAASKCRQKKKEWTQNLEGKARELQTENNSLRLWMDSLRDEYMYLKTQVAEHRSCNNRAVNEFLDDPKRDLLALNNPAARNMLENLHRHPVKQESEDDELYVRSGSLSDEEDALEALLTDSINEATTD